MKRKQQLLQNLAPSSGAELIPGLPLAELGGDFRVLIEHHRGITEYGTAQIRVEMAYGELCIEGAELELTSMSRAQLIIGGRIDALRIRRTAP